MEKKATISELFGINVFNDAAMREYLSEEVYHDLQETIHSHAALRQDTAEAVAEAMKNWAVSREPRITPTGSSR